MDMYGKFKDKSNVYIFKYYLIWPLNRSMLCNNMLLMWVFHLISIKERFLNKNYFLCFVNFFFSDVT